MSLRKSVHMYPTLRCNGKCSYCSNTVPGMKAVHSYQEKLSGHWIKLIRCLEDWEMYFTGGEVFLFQNFSEILSGGGVGSPVKLMKVYTNTMLIQDSFLKAIEADSVLFRCSYHPNTGPVEQFIEKLEIMKVRKIPFQVYMVDAEKNDCLSLKTDVFRKAGHEIGIDHDQRRHVHKKGRVKCFIPSVFIGPDGSVFNCVSRMLRNDGSMGNAFDGYKFTEAEPVVCGQPDLCSPCDLAAAYQEVL